jgi:uncharacterized protein YdcH (DUF465 family)
MHAAEIGQDSHDSVRRHAARWLSSRPRFSNPAGIDFMEQAMSKRSGQPPYRPRRAIPAPRPPAVIAPNDAVATVLIDMQVQLTRIDARLDRMDDRFDTMDDRFDKMDGRFDKMDDRFDKMDDRFDKVDDRFDKVDDRFDRVETRIKEIAMDVHVLTLWKERVFGVIVACGAFAAILAFAINIIKMLGLHSL